MGQLYSDCRLYIPPFPLVTLVSGQAGTTSLTGSAGRRRGNTLLTRCVVK